MLRMAHGVMPGMGEGVDVHNPTIVNIFRVGLHDNFVWLLGIAVLLSVVLALRSVRAGMTSPEWSEPRGRTILRTGLGLLWILDGILQLQAAMPLGLGSKILEPSKESAPTWWHGVIDGAVELWNQHPIALAQSVVWLQLGLGILLLSSSGRTSRIAGRLSAIWALIIWIVTGFGGLFGHAPSFLFGWPGAPIFYVIAGLAVAMSADRFPHVYQAVVTRLLGGVLIFGAILQVLPNNGFWSNGQGNALNAMILEMTEVPQPEFLAGLGHIFAGVVRAAGPGINIMLVVWMMATGVGLWRTTVSGFAWPSRSLVLGSLVGWVLIQDTGLFGGLATDPNSLILVALIAYTLSPAMRTAAPLALRIGPHARVAVANAGIALGSAALLVGIVNGGGSLLRPVESTLYQVYNGDVSSVSAPAPPFVLTDQQGDPFVLGKHRGEVILLSFLDPVCYEECPQIGHQLLDVVNHYANSDRKVTMVVVAANLDDHSANDISHFMSEYNLANTKNVYFLNGSENELVDVFSLYGITVASGGEDGMSIHTNVIYIIDEAGQLRFIVGDDPAPGPAGRASTARVLEDAINSLQK
ncbi:MAG: hypothetical protein EBR99_01675 [Actinobacteria bacterium]|nr:hypothetical protein [Actinomycetota bacterium]